VNVTFIVPAVGRTPGVPYVRTWQMEPLAIAVLASLTPEGVECRLFDDRLEPIEYGAPTDLAAITVETFTARRAYQIAARYRQRGVPVVMGGFHPTLAPEDALEHADAIVIGEAEESWPRLLEDFRAGRMQRVYREDSRPDLAGRFPDRGIYGNREYQPIALVETARGCRFECEFCSVTRFYGRSHRQRPVEDVIREISGLRQRYIFFTDDNIGTDRARFRELLTAMIPMKKSWAAQARIDIADDEDLLDLMRRSGCVCILIGFESLDPRTLSLMGKSVHGRTGIEESAGEALRRHGIGVYGTFVFGYDHDTPASFRDTLEFAQRHGFFFTAFNHLVPFPGTPLFKRLEAEGRLLQDRWWLSEDYRFGDVAFRVRGMSERELADLCYTHRQRFYGPASIMRRMTNWRANCRSPRQMFLYLSLNVLSRNDVAGRQRLPLGAEEGP
jgi:radical SAM superfamily enzyme YgiQ (UPF0313 family)